MDSDAAAAVEAYVTEASTAAASTVLSMVNVGRFGVLELVQMLGPALSGGSVETRRYNATELLGIVLNGAHTVSATEETFITRFLIDRLKDLHSVASVAAALHTSVTKRPGFAGLEVEAAKAVFEHVAVQTMGQQARQHVLGLMLALVRRYPATLREHFGEDFAANVVQQVDQEKDPRCLMAAFALVAAVAREFPLGQHTDALFDVVACYFPITFTPPPNDKVGITREDLIVSLRKCFVASPKFARPFLSLVFETISAPGDDGKVQCYETLAACVGSYPVADIAKFVGHIYSAARQEQFASFDEEIKTAALGALSAFTKALAVEPRASQHADEGEGGVADDATAAGTVDVEESDAGVDAAKAAEGPLLELLDPIVSEGVRHLSDFDMGFVKIQTRLMAACVRVSSVAATYVFTRYVSAALAKHADRGTAPANRVVYIESLRDLLAAVAELAPDVSAAAIEASRDRVFGAAEATISEHGGNNSDAIVAGLGCFAALFNTRVLTHAAVADASSLIVRCATSDDAAVRAAALGALCSIVRSYPRVGLGTVVPALSEATVGANGVAALVAVAVGPQSRCAVLPTLFDRLADAPDADAAAKVARAIGEVCTAGAADGDDQLGLAVLLPCLRLYFATREPAAGPVASDADLAGPAVLGELASGIAACTRVAPAAEQAELLSIVRRVLVENDLSELTLPSRAEPYVPAARSGGVVEGGELTALLCAVVANLRPELVTIEVWHSLQPSLVEGVLAFANDNAAVHCAVALASLLNKLEPDDTVDGVLVPTLVRLDGAQGGEARAAMCRSWLTKAVAIRGHSAGGPLLNRLVADLDDESSAERAAAAFGIIAADTDEGLGPRSFAKATFMYKQRLYAQTSAALIKGYRAGTGVVRSSHLVALVHLLVAVPRQVLLNEVGGVWQLMLESLRACEDNDLVRCVLGLMRMLIDEARERVSEDAHSVVSALLTLCRADHMRTRIAALECLTAAATLPASRIFPLAERVIRELGVVLDDRKRLVRAEAVKCRSAWFLIGGTA